MITRQAIFTIVSVNQASCFCGVPEDIRWWRYLILTCYHSLKSRYLKDFQGLAEQKPQKVEHHANRSDGQVLAPGAHSVELTNSCDHAPHAVEKRQAG